MLTARIMLSGGQRKRAAIAGIMAMRPDVLIFDEPTAGMDATGSIQFLAFLHRLSASGTTVVLAIHDTDLALAWAESVVVLAHGQVARQGLPEEVLLDREFLASAHLRMPAVIEGFRLAYGPRSIPNVCEIPRTMEQLVRLLQSDGRGVLDIESGCQR